MAAVKSNYLSLRYIQNPTLDILKAAVLQDPQAMRQITNLDLDTVVELLKVSTLITWVCTETNRLDCRYGSTNYN